MPAIPSPDQQSDEEEFMREYKKDKEYHSDKSRLTKRQRSKYLSGEIEELELPASSTFLSYFAKDNS
jgi:hypothetical protein